jgi:hypothetical protein
LIQTRREKADFVVAEVQGAANITDCHLGLTLMFSAASGTAFTIIPDSGALQGIFGDLPEGSTIQVGDVQFTISYIGGAGSQDDIVLMVV